jgi:signal transduction histidine kinase
MGPRGPLRLRHVVVGVLVVIVVNAQLTWWIIFVLGQSRSLLSAERDRMEAACQGEAARVAAELVGARELLFDWIVSQEGWRSSGLWRWPPDRLPRPFADWAAAGDLAGEPGWHREEDGRLRFEYPGDDGMRAVVTVAGWESELLAVGEGLELSSADAVSPDRDSRPAVALPIPFEAWVVKPDSDAWDAALMLYRRRILMMVSEGAFFAVMLFVLIGLLFRTLRREVELERQHHNFLSAVTHELKSPLAAMRLSLETVLSGRADADAGQRFLHNALRDTERLESLVQKVLETTRYGRRGGLPEFTPASLSEVVSGVVDTFARSAEARGVVLEREIQPGIWAKHDPEGIAIVVSNLLENAVKYGGDEPTIGLRFWLDDGRALLELSDNGCGIQPEDLPFVFHRFYRSGDELSRTTRGTGLGLYLVRKIVEAHRGTVEIGSTGPQGTTFRVTLPGAGLKEGGP